jgi:hypothetical protein
LKVYESPLKTGVYKVTLYGYVPAARSILTSALDLARNRRTHPLGTILFSYLFTPSQSAADPPLWRLVSSGPTPRMYTNTLSFSGYFTYWFLGSLSVIDALYTRNGVKGRRRRIVDLDVGEFIMLFLSPTSGAVTVLRDASIDILYYQ